MPIVNASALLSDDEVMNVIPGLQLQYDRDFKPAWGNAVPDLKFTFVAQRDIGRLDPSSWPIFLNKHSQEEGDLGWHTQEGKRIYGRCFVGDCLRFGLSWTTDLGHEALETALDPTAQKVFQMADGRLAAYEDCDAVEADKFAYEVVTPTGHRVLCTDFVLPSYFSSAQGARKYDFQGVLKGPCPALSDGGYMSLKEPNARDWSMKEQDHQDGLPGRRFLSNLRHRRVLRRSTKDLIIVNV